MHINELIIYKCDRGLIVLIYKEHLEFSENRKMADLEKMTYGQLRAMKKYPALLLINEMEVKQQ